jgi:hypothetical protein
LVRNQQSRITKPNIYIQKMQFEGENICMNNFKKIIFLIGVTLIFVVISGCNGNTEAKTHTSSSTNMPVSTTASSSSPTEVVLESIDVSLYRIGTTRT